MDASFLALGGDAVAARRILDADLEPDA
jgi:hypothetical protein